MSPPGVFEKCKTFLEQLLPADGKLQGPNGNTLTFIGSKSSPSTHNLQWSPRSPTDAPLPHTREHLPVGTAPLQTNLFATPTPRVDIDCRALSATEDVSRRQDDEDEGVKERGNWNRFDLALQASSLRDCDYDTEPQKLERRSAISTASGLTANLGHSQARSSHQALMPLADVVSVPSIERWWDTAPLEARNMNGVQRSPTSTASQSVDTECARQLQDVTGDEHSPKSAHSPPLALLQCVHNLECQASPAMSTPTDTKSMSTDRERSEQPIAGMPWSASETQARSDALNDLLLKELETRKKTLETWKATITRLIQANNRSGVVLEEILEDLKRFEQELWQQKCEMADLSLLESF